ncbi:MAG TPA: response regulator, partial [Burkholderiales bacterium]|nr:response regulator [Burkholderiales bacterium]
ALKLLLEHDFAVILLDVNMPGMDGLETAGYIRRLQRTAHTPIIFLTAYAEEMQAAYSLGAVDYILTPVLPAILRTKVKVFVQLHQMSRQALRQADQRIALAHEQAARAAAEASKRRSDFLAEASDLLSISLDLDTTAKSLAQFAVPFLADLSALVLVDEHGAVRQTEVCWSGSTDGACRSQSVVALDETAIMQAVERALASGDCEVITDLDPPPTKLTGCEPEAGARMSLEFGFTLRALAVLPLIARDRKLGVLLLGLGLSPRDFSAPELALAKDLAARTAVSLDNCLLYAKIREADQRKNEFLAMLAHELRNPLAPIRNAVHILGQPGLDPAKVKWATSIIDRQSEQLARLVDDLLDVARVTQGRIQLKLEKVSVASVVTVAVETSRPLIEARHHELTIHVPDEPLYVHGDHARLAQVIANLLNNAAKYTEPGGRISIDVQADAADAADVVFRVRDSGIGIPKEMLSSIFDLFTQSEQSLDRSQGGLGIGLTIVQRLLAMQGGTVRVFSAGVGHGSEFVVRLPRLMHADTGQSELQAPRLLPAQCSVLLVDDSPDAVESMALVLQLQGYEVRVAHDGSTALEMARQFKPSVVFLDIGLPDINGYEVARKIRLSPATRDCVLIALTGYGQEEDYQRSMQSGFDHHLVKPIEMDALPQLIESLRSQQNAGNAAR